MNPSFQLIDTGWDRIIGEAVKADRTILRVVCPFIKVRAAKRLLEIKCPEKIQIITRFHLGDMCDGVSDTEALRLLLENGAKVRGIRNLHAKLYIFGDQRAIVTSANLTEAALLRNHEFGFVSSESGIIGRCRDYFEELWKKAGSDLDFERLAAWQKRINEVQLMGGFPSIVSRLSDEGADAGLLPADIISTPLVAEAPQSFVKLFGENQSRASLDDSVLKEIDLSGCHWACSYPKNKRPRQVKDGAVMFMGRLVESPNDIIIYGRAVGMRHVESRDEATEGDIDRRSWKERWPMYIRVHHAEFVTGTLANGIRLSELMDALKSDSFLPTQKNAHKGSGNTDPRKAYNRQAAVQLTKKAFAWLNQRLDLAFAKYGKITPAELEALDESAAHFQSVLVPAHLAAFQDWVVTSDNKVRRTAKHYAYFLIRCAECYGEVINERTIQTITDVHRIIGAIRARPKPKRFGERTFNEGDLKKSLIHALTAYLRFVRSQFPVGYRGRRQSGNHE